MYAYNAKQIMHFLKVETYTGIIKNSYKHVYDLTIWTLKNSCFIEIRKLVAGIARVLAFATAASVTWSVEGHFTLLYLLT